jgi:transposase
MTPKFFYFRSTQVRVAAMFAVSPSFVVKLTQAWRGRGTLEARRQGADRRSAAIEQHREWLLRLVEEARI